MSEPPKPPRACEDCAHFDVHTVEEGTDVPLLGFCRRDPPRHFAEPADSHLTEAPPSVRAIWPTVDAYDWCGEFRKRPR